MLRVAIQLGKYPDEIEEYMSDEDLVEFIALDTIETKRFGKFDYYLSQISAQLEAANTHKPQKASNFVIPEEQSRVPKGWLDLTKPENEEKIKQAFRLYCGSMNKGGK